MSRTLISASAAALLFCVLLLATAARASEPASHDVAVPAEPGQTVVIEWAGTSLPGATGIGSMCLPAGPDDSHAITLTVPEGTYEGFDVAADFQIEWESGEPVGPANTRDLALSVYRDTTTEVGSSDGSSPQETVGVINPEAGAYSVVVCPFIASEPVPYTGRLTLRAVEQQACVQKPTTAKAHAALAAGGGPAGSPEDGGLPNFDLFHKETGSRDRDAAGDWYGRHQPALVDRTLGVPTFLWARTDAPVAVVGALSQRELLAAHARAHLRREAKVLRLSEALIEQADVADAQFNGNGPAVVRLRQRVDGIEVFQRSLNVLLDRSYRPIAVSGYFATGFDTLANRAFTLGAPQAIATAWASLGGALAASDLTPAQTRGDWQWYTAAQPAGSHFFERAPRAKRVYYPRAGALEPAYHVELLSRARVNGQLSAYALVVSAADGGVLHRANLRADAAFSYRVFADAQAPLHQPYDSPLGNDYAPFPAADRSERLARTGAPMNFVTLEHAGIVTGDPWLEDGAGETAGNHVDACFDQYDVSVNTPAGGLAVPPPVNSCIDGVEARTPTTSANTFDYAMAADADPAEPDARSAAIVNLFYMNNWLHDWWYNHGFDEASGNAQADNKGRGGEEGDPILAHGQDGSGRNNANMATPSDGSSPVMQQYLFDGPARGEVRVIAPADGGPLAWAPAAFSKPEYEPLVAEVVLADDGAGVSPTDGCNEALPDPGLPLPPPTIPAPPQSSLQGRIALVDRGNCNFTVKAQFAMASGAIALVVVNNGDGDPITMGNADIPVGVDQQPTDLAYQQIPALMIRKADGDAIKAQLAAGPVEMSLARQASVDTDGTLDNQIIAHEYFHYVHHRLTDSSNQQSRAMSEGWGDISGFMLSVRPEDRFVPGNDAWQGAYGLAGYVSSNFFSGIRRAPYTTDFGKNAFTFRHIADGEPTPDGGNGAINSEVHNAGELWANMMFECYAGLLKARSDSAFVDAQSRMQDYIIGGLKMTPADATYTEARDAVLAVVLATDFDDYAACSRGFARRGIGLNAVAPARGSSDLVGVVEDFSEFTCKAGTGAGAGELPDNRGEQSPAAGGFGLLLLAPLLGAAVLRRRRHS